MPKLLVIEDEPPLLEEIVETLQFEGFDVSGAPGGLAGLQAAREQLPDLIISDITMPDMEGYEVLQELRRDSNTATIPFIFLSARSDRTDIRRGMLLGADDYLTKPFTHADLLGAVRAQLEKQSARATHRLRQFARRLVSIQENERRQLAQELQEDVGQLLTVLQLTLATVHHLPPQELTGALQQSETLLETLSDQIHRMALNLYPGILEHLGLLPALLWLFKTSIEQKQLRVNFSHSGLNRSFHQEIKIAAYRILQEALVNVIRHAGVTEVQVRVWVEQDVIHLEVADSGQGFYLENTLNSSGKTGLTLMWERAIAVGGTLTIVSSPGQGTQVIARLPLTGTAPGAIDESIRQLSGSATVVSPVATPRKSRRVRVLVAGDKSSVQALMQRILATEADMEVTAETSLGTELVEALRQRKPDVLVLNLRLSNGQQMDFIRQLAIFFPVLRILVVAAHEDEAYAWTALKNGAHGYLPDRHSPKHLAAAVRTLAAGQPYLNTALLSGNAPADVHTVETAGLDSFATLTEREREVFMMVVQGNTNAEVAEKLVISLRTVETHRANMMRKLGVRNKTGLMHYAFRRGLLPAEPPES